MFTITKQKPLEEIIESLSQCRKIYITGCGTCATMLHTGGKSEVLEMKRQLEAAGKEVTGWMVVPTGCDPITKQALIENGKNIEDSDCLLVMCCAFGVQTVSLYSNKPVYPALNTLFIGWEESPGTFREVCVQCGQCIIGETAGICPLTACHKGLVNGPCGGTNDGKCEVDKNADCAWTLIYNRLKAQGRLDLMQKHQLPRNFHATLRPKVLKIQ